MVVPGDQVFDTIIAMVIAIVAYGLLAAYVGGAGQNVARAQTRG